MRPILLGLAAVAAAGCEAGSAPASTSRDSLGVTIVESTAPSWAEGDEWRIVEEPVVDLAESGSGDMHLFFRVGDVLRTPAGDLAVTDRGSQQIRIYDVEGRFLRAFGGAGEGPGEFRSLWSMVLTHQGTLLGVDYRPGGPGAEFDIVSGLISTFRLLGEANPVQHPVPSDIVWGLEAGYTVQDDDLEGGLQRHPATVVRMSADRTSVHPVATVPGWEHVVVPEGDAIPLMPRVTQVVPTGRGEVVLGIAEALEYSILDGETGEVRMIARLPGIWLAVTGEDVDRERQARLGPNPSPFTRDLLDRLPVPTEKPAYQSMLVDIEGNVWAGEYLGIARMDEPQDWYVWDASGVWLGMVETPARFELMRVGSDAVFGVRRDMNDVEHPQVLRLVKPRS
ncbi:MAG: hypothetical protein F4Y24_04125 [Gemmatimonadetes bacterium]|nr:hypothetical protein [Gemmatimonadota bacterium]MYG20965.1 hypothetical protein [Gemmatimonadota bacterium]MYJ38395.1 hypothetical protein [Gemmatimonadota bacterium]